MERLWIALLRAVNLGSRNKVPMAELRRVLQEAGCRSVRTYIQSGNVLFEHEAPERDVLEAAVADAFGVKTVVVLRTASQIRDLAGSHPFGPDTSKSAVAFTAETPARARLRALRTEEIAPDRFELVDRDVVLYYPNGFAGARLSAARLEQLLGVPVTARNWRTVAKLAELAG